MCDFRLTQFFYSLDDPHLSNVKNSTLKDQLKCFIVTHSRDAHLIKKNF